MKVGDIYEKNGKKYEVLQILGMNCWSEREVGEADPVDVPVLEETPVVEEAPVEEVEEAPVIVEKKPRGRRKKA